MVTRKRGSVGKEGASLRFATPSTNAASTPKNERDAPRLAASDPGCGAEADDEPKRDVKRWQTAAQFFLAPAAKAASAGGGVGGEGGAAKIGGEADAVAKLES